MNNKFRVLYHSSIKITDGINAYFDPYCISETTNDADFIFITHDHYDHFSPEDIKKILCDSTVIFAPFSLQKELKDKNAVFLKPYDTYCIDGIEIEAIPAYNIEKSFHPKENDWIGYIVTINNIRYYIAGDTDVTPENRNVKCDVMFIPVGGTYTTNYKEASELANSIMPSVAIPTHFGSIAGEKTDGENFKKLLSSEIKCKIITEKF